MAMSSSQPAAPRRAHLGESLQGAATSDFGVTFVKLDEREEHLSWRELHVGAQRAAGYLRGIGIRSGDRVAIVLRTGPGFFTAFFGVLLAGAIPVPLYPPVRLGRLDEYHASTARMVRRVGARLILTEPVIARLFGETLARAQPELGLRLVAQLEQGGASETGSQIGPDDIALIQFSSGSTVEPKPVCLTHRQILTQIATLQGIAQPDASREAFLSWLPLYHDMGLIGALLSTLDFPGPLVLLAPESFLARPALWLRAMSRHRATISGAPSFAYGLCVKRIADADLEGVDLSAWRLAFNGAEPISAAVVRRFCERFGRYGFSPEALRPVYGLSEATLAVTFPPPRNGLRTLKADAAVLANKGALAPGDRELVSVGAPIPGVEIELRSPDGEAVGEDTVGRIYVRGPSVMKGYFDDDAATARALSGGWLDTGDLGVLREGELYMVGRVKDLVIVRGGNHPPQEFEECLEGLPGLRPGCHVALGFQPNGGEGEELLVLAEVTEPVADRGRLEEGVRAAILARTGVRAHSVRLLAPGTLPRTSSGKLRRGEALRRYLSGELRPPKRVNAARLVGEMARSSMFRALSRLRRSGDA
jgi:acyl-CoA synthetase (AMP-forming)/AMP-acid ligase II